MPSDFALITEEFNAELQAIRSLVSAFDSPKGTPRKVRIAAARSATLLLAATFEEFVRDMARSFARKTVASTASFDKLPNRMTSSAWRLSMQGLSRIRIQPEQSSIEISKARGRFNAIFKFYNGDLTQDIYDDLIHNENNMLPGQINALFRISGLKNICSKVADKQPMLANLGEDEPGKAHERLREQLEAFFDRRNFIAHSLGSAQSIGPAQIQRDIDMFMAFGESLPETLDQ